MYFFVFRAKKQVVPMIFNTTLDTLMNSMNELDPRRARHNQARGVMGGFSDRLCPGDPDVKLLIAVRQLSALTCRRMTAEWTKFALNKQNDHRMSRALRICKSSR